MYEFICKIGYYPNRCFTSWHSIGQDKMRIVVRILAIIAFTVGFISPAYAYLDPGTGSIILQGVIGGIAAGAAVIGLYWQKVKAFVSSYRQPNSETKDKG